MGKDSVGEPLEWGIIQALKVLKIDYSNGNLKSKWGRELRWLEKKDREIEEYSFWIVDEFNKWIEDRYEGR